MTLQADDPEAQARLSAFVQGLKELGWTDGRNVQIDFRFDPDIATTRKHAAELVALVPDVILANGSAAAGPLLQATHTVPIVFVIVPDPVGAGFVASLARPGGHFPRTCGLPEFLSSAQSSGFATRSRLGIAPKRQTTP
jgi:putative ABC transport system substrate-binding protein